MILPETPVKALMASDQLSQKVIGEAMHVHRVLGPGFLESIYQNSLLIRLRKAGIDAESGKPLPVEFEGEVVGSFQTDIIVEGRLLLELKAVSALVPAHEVQLVNYLTAIRLKVGLLLNFGAKSLEIKRRTLGYLDTKEKAPISSRSNRINHINPIQP
jgi:GxxExxY protein